MIMMKTFLSKEPSASTLLEWAIHEQITITPMVPFSTELSNNAEDEYVSWYPLADETVMSLKAM